MPLPDPRGHDASGALTVTVDPADRITEVTVHGPADHLRDPQALAVAVDEAALAARVARLEQRHGPPSSGEPRHPTARPLGVGARRVENHQETGTAPSGRLRGLSAHFTDRDLGPATGRSRNGCASVTLDPASAHGRLRVDGAWLANTRSAHVGAAISQAYRDAYRKQDRS